MTLFVTDEELIARLGLPKGGRGTRVSLIIPQTGHAVGADANRIPSAGLWPG